MENLDLINWKMVSFSSLWIIGLAVILAVFGFVDYHAKVSGSRFRDQLRKPNYQAWVNVGLALFCFGLLGSAKALWEAILWGILAIAFIVFGISSFRAWKRSQNGEE
jgi:hypothetical protein